MASPHEDHARYSDSVLIEMHRTADVGVAFVFDPDGYPVVQFSKNGSNRRKWFSYPPGTVFSVRLLAYWGTEAHDETFRFEVTDEVEDAAFYWVGPGITKVPTKNGRGRDVGFEHGVTVAGARRLP